MLHILKSAAPRFHCESVRAIGSNSGRMIAEIFRTKASRSGLQSQTLRLCGSSRKVISDNESNNEKERGLITDGRISGTLSDLTETLGFSKKEIARLGLQDGILIFGVAFAKRKTSLLSKLGKISVSMTIVLLGCVGALVLLIKLAPMFVEPSVVEPLKIGFEDVPGVHEATQELSEVVEFLKDPVRAVNLETRLRKGILLSGPKGTDKLSIARAIAGEAGVPFYFSPADSKIDVALRSSWVKNVLTKTEEQIESSRIRNLFARAKKNSPCVIFIDESSLMLDQLLQEMDRVDPKKGIIVFSKTDMTKALDETLTRPGRFDAHVKMSLPDVKGRQEILDFYAKKLDKLGDDFDGEKVAQLTSGLAGADLSILTNQAAQRAAKLSKPFVETEDFEYVIRQLLPGTELKTRLRNSKVLTSTAFHEAGHVLVGHYTPDSLPLESVTIRRNGETLGHTQFIPTHQQTDSNATKANLMWFIDTALAGRVAEEISFGSNYVTIGAHADFKIATKLVYELVCDYAMSASTGYAYYDLSTVSPERKKLIEDEVDSILNASYNRAKQILTEYSSQHKLLAQALLRYETLDLDDVKILFETNSVEALGKLRNTVQVS